MPKSWAACFCGLPARTSAIAAGTELGWIGTGQCQGGVAACCGGWILITWCLAHRLGAAFGLASMRFVGIRCEGPAGVT